MNELVCLDELLIPKKEAKIFCLDPGFLYGEGLFETMRAYGGVVFRLKEHLERLFNSLSFLGMPFKFSLKKLESLVQLTLKANHLKEAYLRLNVWRGKKRTHLLVIAKMFDCYHLKDYKRGFKATIVNIRRNELSPLSRIKSFNFLENLLAMREAKERGADEAILLNSKGFVAEGSRSNIFLVVKNRIFTPSKDCGILPGITRKVVLEIAKEKGLEIAEKKIGLQGLFKAQEAFLTNSLMGLMPLSYIGGEAVGLGAPGLVTLFLIQAYRSLVKEETRCAVRE